MIRRISNGMRHGVATSLHLVVILIGGVCLMACMAITSTATWLATDTEEEIYE